MPAPALPVLGAASLNRKWFYQFNTNTIVAPAWNTCGGVNNSHFQPDTPNWVVDTDQAGQGSQSSTKTGGTWTGDLTIIRKSAQGSPTTYDTVQEFLRLHAIGQYGSANTVQVRVFEYDPNDPNGLVTPRVEAYTGFCGVGWVPAGGDMMAEDTVVVSLVGQGKLTVITHPYPATATVPVITSVSPTALAVAGGDLVTILGSGFTGATGVSFAGTAATRFVVEADNMIVAVAPAHTAGTGPVVVTNAAGPSTTGSTVTYA